MHGHEDLAGQRYAIRLEEKGLKNRPDYFQQWPPRKDDKYAGPEYLHGMMAWDLPEELHHSHWIGERTVAGIERCVSEQKPFFLWSSFFDPHPPYTVPQPWAGMYKPEDMVRIPMIARYPGHIPAGNVTSALQSQVDFAPTFLTAVNIATSGLMQGVNRFDVRQGRKKEARDWVIVENRHNPTTVHLRTYINERYKITVYRNAEYGELFDLKEDPQESSNRWDDPSRAEVKSKLLLKFVQAEIQREPTRMPRIANA